MRTRELLKLKYEADIRGNTRFACKRYFDDTCPHYKDTCDCPRNDWPNNHSKDNCPDFKQVSMKLYQEALCWERKELEEML